MNTTAAHAEHNQGFHLHLHHRVEEAEPFYQRAVALDPEFKEAWMNLGLVLLSLGRPDEALTCQRQALRLDPDSADAQNNLGMIHYAQGHIAEAENCFRTALRLRPDHANATLNLGSARQILNHINEADHLFRRALSIGVDEARAKSNLALALMEQVRPREAEQCCREALALRPDYPEARANLALALLMMGRLEEGFQEYESRWDVEAMGTPAPALTQPRWTGQPLNGETVLLYAEQGFGDTLQFCRYVPMVAAAGGQRDVYRPGSARRRAAPASAGPEVKVGVPGRQHHGRRAGPSRAARQDHLALARRRAHLVCRADGHEAGRAVAAGRLWAAGCHHPRKRRRAGVRGIVQLVL